MPAARHQSGSHPAQIHAPTRAHIHHAHEQQPPQTGNRRTLNRSPPMSSRAHPAHQPRDTDTASGGRGATPDPDTASERAQEQTTHHQ